MAVTKYLSHSIYEKLAMPQGIQFPFKETDTGGIIRPTYSSPETTKSDLIAFLTLRRGQRPMHNDLYSPLYDFIFEQFDAIAEKELMDAMEEKLKKFFPEIKLNELVLNFTEETHVLEVKVIYSIPEMGNITDSINLEFMTNQ